VIVGKGYYAPPTLLMEKGTERRRRRLLLLSAVHRTPMPVALVVGGVKVKVKQLFPVRFSMSGNSCLKIQNIKPKINQI